MKVISIWQPWASLIMTRQKFFETRTWSAPKSLIGQRIGIAATKNIIAGQKAAYMDSNFQFFYEDSGLPPMDELPRGVLLGTVLLHSVELMTDELLDDITDEELAYGWYEVGGFAWRLRDPKPLEHPIPIKGAQGFYDFKGFENAPQIQVQNKINTSEKGSPQIRGNLSLIKRE